MVRSLNIHPGIPAEVLSGKPGADLPEDLPDLDSGRLPLKEMAKLMHRAGFDKPIDIFPLSGSGDVSALKRTLAKAIALDKQYSGSDGPEKKRISAYYQEALKSKAPDTPSILGTSKLRG